MPEKGVGRYCFGKQKVLAFWRLFQGGKIQAQSSCLCMLDKLPRARSGAEGDNQSSAELWKSRFHYCEVCCLVWTCFPLRYCSKRPSLHTSITLTHKINLGYDKWSTCCCALADYWDALVLLIDHSIKLSSEASTKNIIHFSQMAESTVIPRRISRAVSFYITWEPDYLP